MTKKGWEEFFDGHASRYMGEVFVKNAREEVDFLMEELKLQPGNTILDVGCGTGRHAVEFARRGFKMTGVDLSSGMLAEAEKAAASAGVTIELVHNNAAAYKPDKKSGNLLLRFPMPCRRSASISRKMLPAAISILSM